MLECGPSPPSFPVAVHVIVKKDDYIICYLDYQEKIVQQSLDLHISEGEEIAVYVQNISKSDSQSVTVHLTGCDIGFNNSNNNNHCRFVC